MMCMRAVISIVSDSLQPYRPPDPSEHGILQAKYWSGLPCPSPEDLPNPGTEAGSPALQANSLPSKPPGQLSYLLLQSKLTSNVAV